MIRVPLSQLVTAVLVPLVLASCGGAAMNEKLRADSDPHAGVARAHALPVQGIDISKYQGDIDWARARKDGIRFAYLKVSEGGDRVDDRFYDNWAGAAAAGIPRGAYHFMYWCRTASEQAEWFAQAVPQMLRSCRRCLTSNGTMSRPPARSTCRATRPFQRSGRCWRSWSTVPASGR